MKLDYKKLFDLLKGKNILQKTFLSETQISHGTMQHLRNNESVTTESIGRICEYLQCQPNDIMEIIYDEEIIKLNLMEN